MVFNPIFRQNSGCQARQIELKMFGPAGYKKIIQIARISTRKRVTNLFVDLVAAFPDRRADRSGQEQAAALAANGLQTDFDDPGRQTTPAGVNRADNAAIEGRHQDRDTIRGHDAHAEAGCRREDRVRARPIWFRSGSRGEHIDPVDLHRKHCVFRGLSATLTESMLETKIYENAIA